MLQYLRANALATAALVVATSGTSYALLGLPRNTVGSPQIRKGGVHASDVHKNAVTNTKIKTAAVSRTKLAVGAVSPSKIAAGAVTRAAIGTGVLPQAFAARTLAGSAPSTTPEIDWGEKTFTTTTAGHVFAFGRGRLNILCTGTTSVNAGLYLDDVPITASGMPFATATSTEVNVWGATDDVVPAGSHTLTLSSDCVGGTGAGGSSFGGDGALGLLVLGD